MTKRFSQFVDCPECGTRHTAESAFSRWVRQNAELDSADGVAVSDCDMWIHRFARHGRREVQHIMLLEIKTRGRAITESQQDTLNIVHQIIENRKPTPTIDRKERDKKFIQRVWSAASRRWVGVVCHGVHTLTLSGNDPVDSDTIIWDRGKAIDVDTLTRLLRLDIDPGTFEPISARPHHESSLLLFAEAVA